MPIVIGGHACSICGRVFLGTGSKAAAMECEALGKPAFQFSENFRWSGTRTMAPDRYKMVLGRRVVFERPGRHVPHYLVGLYKDDGALLLRQLVPEETILREVSTIDV